MPWYSPDILETDWSSERAQDRRPERPEFDLNLIVEAPAANGTKAGARAVDPADGESPRPATEGEEPGASHSLGQSAPAASTPPRRRRMWFDDDRPPGGWR